MTEVRAVKIAGLQTDRPWPDDEGIDALAADIRRHGVKEPILVIGREEYVLDGVRRVAAMRKLGRENIPALVSDDMFDVAIRMYETHQPEDLTSRRRVEIIRHVHALMGNRVAQADAAERLGAYLKEANKQEEVSVVLRQSGTSRTLMVLAARAARPYTRIQYLPPIIRAADHGDPYARELLARFEADDMKLTAMGSLWKERNGRPGDIVKAAEQREVFTQAGLSLASTVYALQKLGPIHPSISVKELLGYIKNLYDPRSDLTVVINKLRKESKDRYEQDS
jgi:ParB-like chromosome segregation protein Spo0J